jgi:hypothetical protein
MGFGAAQVGIAALAALGLASGVRVGPRQPIADRLASMADGGQVSAGAFRVDATLPIGAPLVRGGGVFWPFFFFFFAPCSMLF